MISHQTKTPLQHILIFIGILSGNDDTVMLYLVLCHYISISHPSLIGFGPWPLAMCPVCPSLPAFVPRLLHVPALVTWPVVFPAFGSKGAVVIDTGKVRILWADAPNQLSLLDCSDSAKLSLWKVYLHGANKVQSAAQVRIHFSKKGCGEMICTLAEMRCGSSVKCTKNEVQ